MKILMVMPPNGPNPYPDVLASQLENGGHSTFFGVDKFWNNPSHYDLIYFQWTNVVFLKCEKTQEDYIKLENHLNMLTQIGVKMIITCHNLKPHISDDFWDKISDLIYAKVDIIHHLGEYSYKHFKTIYPHKKHFIAPHPYYYDLKSISFPKEVCRKKIRLSEDKQILIAFGDFRKKEEKQMIYTLRKEIPNLCIIAPRFIGGFKGEIKSLIKQFPFRVVKYFYYKYFKGIKCLFKYEVKEEDISTYLCAADLLLIQRKNILNSGNVPLAFSAGLPVVGPDLGNVGIILKETGNFVFKVDDDNADLVKVVKLAISNKKALIDIGDKNYDYSIKHWNINTIGKIICENLKILMP